MDSHGPACDRRQRKHRSRPNGRHRSGARALGAALLGVALFGCQAYDEAPLELAHHMRDVGARLAAPLPGATGAEGRAFSLSDGATLAECEAFALFFNPDLRLARERIGVARATRDTAGLWQDPVFGFDGAQVLSPGDDFEYGAVLSLTLPVSGRLAAECERAEAAWEAELWRVAEAEWNVRAELRQAFYLWSSLDRRRELLEELLDQVDRVADMAQRLEAAGALSKAQSGLIRIEAVARRAELMDVRLDADLARLNVLGLAGMAPNAPVELTRPQPDLLPLPTEDALAHVEATHAGLATLRAEYQMAEASLRLAIRRQYPDLNVGLGPGSADEDTRVVLGVSLPLPLWNRNAREIAQRRAARDVARVAAEVALERAVRETEQAALTQRSVAGQRAAIEDSLQPLLEEQARTIADLADLGDVDAFLLLESLKRRYDAASRLLELEASEASATVELLRLVGPPSNPTPNPQDAPVLESKTP